MPDDRLPNIIKALQELESDNTVPKNIKAKISTTIKVLHEDSDLGIKINRALNELDELTDDNNIQPYTRTQIWNIVSMLEMIG